MTYVIFAFLLTINFFLNANSLFDDLEIVRRVDEEINDKLPFFYNESLVGGYLNMPSARMAETGTVAFGGGRVPPYNIYGLNFQPFERMELAGNYRVFKGIKEPNFGREGFGDDADRIGNIKLAALLPSDGYDLLPSFSIGADDFMGSKRFNAQYIVMTKQWLNYNFECTLGWGRKRLKGFFGGAAWTPFRKSCIPILKDISLIAEYDAYDYKKHQPEHPKGRKVSSRINGGIAFVGWDTLQITAHSVRGEKIAVSGSIRYPLGTTCGLLPKIDDPPDYLSPIVTEPIGLLRTDCDFVQELAYALSDQGLDLFSVYLFYNCEMKKEFWIKIVNNRYRLESDVRDRLQHVLSAVMPCDIAAVTVVIEADAFPCHSYRFCTEDLYRFRQCLIGTQELEILAPMIEAVPPPGEYDSTLLFHRRKSIWEFTLRPRLLTFFGSASGKFKYNLGLIASPEGYLFDQIYYKFQLSYAIKSSMVGLSSTDRLNPSQLPNVRTDTLKYFQTNTVSVEQAYLQKSFNLGKGYFCRVAGGYFEPAYGGGAAEILYYPVDSSWAIGVQSACVMKRRYKGIAFTHKIRKLDGHTPHYIGFLGVQYFLNLYYEFEPLKLDLEATIGQFLAKDKGIRMQVSRYFQSGVSVGIWYTVTNGHDHVNGHTYYDKGFFFSIPLDIFLKQSSRNYIGYAMSAWLRDVGAQAATGKPLYTTLYDERR